MKAKHFYYVCMTACFFMTMLGIGFEDDKAMHFGILGFISGGIHYLAEKIEELKK